MPKRKFFEIHPNWGLRPPGWEVVNGDRLQPDKKGFNPKIGWPDGFLTLPNHPYRIPPYTEAPCFVINKKLGRDPKDFETQDGYFFVSSKLKELVETVDPESSAFILCESRTLKGEPWREIWMGTVTRMLVGAVDEQACTDLRFSATAPNGKRGYGFGPYTKYVFFPQSVEGFHLFRIGEMSIKIICDDVFKKRCKDAGITGITFDDTNF